MIFEVNKLSNLAIPLVLYLIGFDKDRDRKVMFV
jgi:hypothetical protein